MRFNQVDSNRAFVMSTSSDIKVSQALRRTSFQTLCGSVTPLHICISACFVHLKASLALDVTTLETFLRFDLSQPSSFPSVPFLLSAVVSPDGLRLFVVRCSEKLCSQMGFTFDDVLENDSSGSEEKCQQW